MLDRLRAWVGRWKSPARARALLGGLFLLSVPTMFTVVPGWTRSDGRIRLAVLVLWVVVALLVIASQRVREEHVDALTAAAERRHRTLRLATLTEILKELLRPRTMGFPLGYEFTVYLSDGDLLKPIWPSLQLRPGETDPRIFKPGDGATGSAWKEQLGTFVVRGDAVHSDRHGLRPDQQAFFADYHVAAATLITAGDDPIGVLTALRKHDDNFFADGAAGVPLLQHLAGVVGMVLDTIPHPDDLKAIAKRS